MIGLALLLAAAADPPQMSTCLKDGDELKGQIRWVDSRQPGAKADLRFPFLVLDKLSCFDTAQGRAFGRWVQLGLSKDEMKGLTAGNTLIVKANFSIPTNAFTIGDVVAMDAVIISQSPP